MLKLLQVSEIVQGKNIRSEKDSEIFELAESIERQGLINPITVQKRDDGKYEVIAGHRRFEAIKRLGYPHVECNILDDLNEKEIILAQIAENCQRKQMSASELVDTFEDLKERFRMNQAAIAKQFGKSDTWVSNQYQAVRLLASQYGEKVPKAEKKKTAGQIKNDAKKAMTSSELIICEGMKVQVNGHKYTIYCSDNTTENLLRDFINGRRAGRSRK
jgi:ParB family chromosome partitioning protein